MTDVQGPNDDYPAGPLLSAISDLPPPYDEERAGQLLAELTNSGTGKPFEAELCQLLQSSQVQDLLKSVFGSSPYLGALIERDPGRLIATLQTPPEARFEQLQQDLVRSLSERPDRNGAMRALRQFKNAAALLAALCDITGAYRTMQVTDLLARTADVSLSATVRYLFARAVDKGDWLAGDNANPQNTSGFIVLGMGKLGAFELNFSSDIDLIIFFDRQHARVREGLDVQPFFVKLTRDLVALMQERTAEGYVFRTDLRLRPDPGSTQVALSTDAAYSYYENFAQNWERAALIKARPVAGDLEAGQNFIRQIAPFIWRKYLDFAAIADVHAMKRQVNSFKGYGDIRIAGHNVKLGRGGIREIEFFAQTQQLIAGGRQPELRSRQTLKALEALTERGWISEVARTDMTSAYLFLRHVEHRIQMIADEQTHIVPENDDKLLQLAKFSGFTDVAAFSKALRQQLEAVQVHYAALFEDVPGLADSRGNLVFTGDTDDPGTITTLDSMGFANATGACQIVRAWHFGRYVAMRSARARERLTEFQPVLLEALAKTTDPDQALANFDKFLSELPAGVQLFSLLRNAPELLRLLADIMGTAPRLARILSRRPRLLEAILDPGFFGKLPTAPELSEKVSVSLSNATDYQDCLDQARIVGSEQKFLIGVQVLSGSVSTSQVGASYAMLAENLITQLQDRVICELSQAHGSMAGGAVAIVAMGKLGGREMNARSDLDLIVVYDFDHQAPASDGPRPLMGEQYYNRFTQRLITALSTMTAEGALYEVDMRLRPSGHSGPVAARLESFVDYQHKQAWTWEHMALSRARVISGCPVLKATIETTIRNVLSQPRDRARIANDVREMRQRIAREKKNAGLWDLKYANGGVVDLEFVVQYLQLVNGHAQPEILAENTHDVIAKLAAAGLLSAGHADTLSAASNLYTNLTQLLTLCMDGVFSPDDAPDGLKNLLARAGSVPDFSQLEDLLRETLSAVADCYDEIIL